MFNYWNMCQTYAANIANIGSISPESSQYLFSIYCQCWVFSANARKIKPLFVKVWQYLASVTNIQAIFVRVAMRQLRVFSANAKPILDRCSNYQKFVLNSDFYFLLIANFEFSSFIFVFNLINLIFF